MPSHLFDVDVEDGVGIGDAREALEPQGGRLRELLLDLRLHVHVGQHAMRQHVLELERGEHVAERELDRSVSLDPSNPTVHLWHAELLLGMGEVADAVGHARMAQALDPLTAVTNQTLSRTLREARRYGEASAAASKGLAIDSTFSGLYVTLIEAEMLGGHADSAARVADRALRIARRGLGVRSAAIWAYRPVC